MFALAILKCFINKGDDDDDLLQCIQSISIIYASFYMKMYFFNYWLISHFIICVFFVWRTFDVAGLMNSSVCLNM